MRKLYVIKDDITGEWNVTEEDGTCVNSKPFKVKASAKEYAVELVKQGYGSEVVIPSELF